MPAHTNIDSLLASVGIIVNGPNPWDIQIHNRDFYDRLLIDRNLGLGESYMDGWWDCKSLDGFFFRIFRDQGKIRGSFVRSNWLLLDALRARLVNLQSSRRAFEVGRKHYDIGNELFTAMLDPTLSYSCGYWKDAANLNGAQQQKLELCCKKLQLQRGMRLLDIGCGWGGMARYAAERYGVEVVGITVSEQQQIYAQKDCAGLPVQILLQDYRTPLPDPRTFDRIVSLGMIEAVGHKNYRKFLEIASRLLNDDGLFLLHTIGSNAAEMDSYRWLTTYIFPNGEIPSMRQLTDALEHLFIVEDWHNFGTDYDLTLMAWHQNFKNAWPALQKADPKYDERFYRMWSFYLLSCAGNFRARAVQLWQVLLSKKGIVGGLRVPR